MNDLTSFLSTIASASASIVAILGGFIASKLLSINNEREKVLSKLKEVEEQKSFKIDELKEIQTYIDEDESLGYIKEHIEDILKKNPVDEVYSKYEQNAIDLEVLRPYWERALFIWSSLLEYYTSEDGSYDINSDDIPKELAGKYISNELDYRICKMLVSKIKKELRKQQTNSNITVPFTDLDVVDMINPIRMNSDNRINELKSEIKWLEFQSSQFNKEKEGLKKPKGMKAGLIIFAMFSFGCIILPLSLYPISLDTVQEYRILKYVLLSIFVIGLGSIFLYLRYLLKWREGEK